MLARQLNVAMGSTQFTAWNVGAIPQDDMDLLWMWAEMRASKGVGEYGG